MAEAVNLDSRVAEAIAIADVGANPIFGITPSKPGDATHRPQYEGALDPAETVRVRAYIPESFTDSELVMTPKNLRAGKDGVLRSRDGKVNVAHFEDTKANVLVILWAPVGLSIKTLTVVR